MSFPPKTRPIATYYQHIMNIPKQQLPTVEETSYTHDCPERIFDILHAHRSQTLQMYSSELSINHYIPSYKSIHKIIESHPKRKYIQSISPLIESFFKDGKSYADLLEQIENKRAWLRVWFVLSKYGFVTWDTHEVFSAEESIEILEILNNIYSRSIQENFGDPTSIEHLIAKEQFLTSIFGKNDIIRKYYQFHFVLNTFYNTKVSPDKIHIMSQWIDSHPKDNYDDGFRYILDAHPEEKRLTLFLKTLREEELCYHLYIPAGRIIDLKGFVLEHDPRIIIHSIQNFRNGKLKQTN